MAYAYFRLLTAGGILTTYGDYTKPYDQRGIKLDGA